MKKFIHYIILVVFVSLMSCSKDLLDVTNPNLPTKDTFWKTTDDLQLALTATYSQFTRPGNWGRWIYFRYDLTSDEGFSNTPWTELKNWTNFTYTNYNFIQGGSLIYKSHYKQIFEANQILTYGDSVKTTSDADLLLKKQIQAQAKFIRAFDYFNLVIMFGNAEIVLKPSEPGDVYLMGTSDELYQIIIKDLTEAATDLPEEWKTVNKGRITKGAAYALLGKVYMQMHEWQKAKDAFNWLVEGAGSKYYGLMDKYTDNFSHLTENNKESVFEIQFSDANETPTDMNNGTMLDDDISAMNVGNTRSQFLGLKGKGWCDGQPRSWLVAEYKKEPTLTNAVNGTFFDDRLKSSMVYPEFFKDYPGITLYMASVKKWNAAWGKDCFFRKYTDESFKKDVDYYSPINYRVIRYADVLLCYAECLAQLNDVSAAANYVDKVRNRPSTNLPKLSQSKIPEIADCVTSKEKFLKRLQMERSLELSFESVRWIDLKRWGLLDTQEGLDELILRDPDFKNFIIDKNQVMPLPQIEVDNNPNLHQNPNY